MSLLGKYKSSTGFVQLMRLLELSDAEKQKSLLLLVGEEDPGWARLVQLKMISREKILLWPQDVLEQILTSLDARLLAALVSPQVCHSDVLIRENVKRSVPARVFRELTAILAQSSFSESERWAASIQLIQNIREMEHLGLIDLSQVDPALKIHPKLVA